MIKHDFFKQVYPSSAIICYCLILIRAFHAGNLDRDYPLIFPFVYFAAFGISLIISIGRLVQAHRDGHGLPRLSIIGFVQLLVIFIAAILGPYLQFGMAQDFLINYQKRMEVVEMVKQGKLVPRFESQDDPQSCALPPSLKNLSRNGAIRVCYESGVVSQLNGMVVDNSPNEVTFTLFADGARYSSLIYHVGAKVPNDSLGENKIFLCDHWYWIFNERRL